MTQRLAASIRRGRPDDAVSFMVTSGSRMDREIPASQKQVLIGKKITSVLGWGMQIRRSNRAGARILVVCGSIKDKLLLNLVLGILGVRFVVYVPLTDRFSSMGYKFGLAQDWVFRAFYAGIPSGWLTITTNQALQLRSWLGVKTAIFTLPNTISEDLERAAPELRPARRPRSHMNILVLGRLDAHQKGLDVLLKYLRSNLADVSSWAKVMIVGDGPFRQELDAALSSEHRLREVVSIEKWMAPREALKSCDVLFLPSRYEGVPLVMLEAMACGRPVVAARLPGTAQFLSEEFLFDKEKLHDGFGIMKALLCSEAYSRASADVVSRYEIGASGTQFEVAVEKLARDMSIWDGK